MEEKKNPSLSTAGSNLREGIYEHYKGNRYRVFSVALHSETLEEFVVYQALYGKKGVWVRPLSLFLNKVELAGKKVPRFKYLGDG